MIVLILITFLLSFINYKLIVREILFYYPESRQKEIKEQINEYRQLKLEAYAISIITNQDISEIIKILLQKKIRNKYKKWKKENERRLSKRVHHISNPSVPYPKTKQQFTSDFKKMNRVKMRH